MKNNVYLFAMNALMCCLFALIVSATISDGKPQIPNQEAIIGKLKDRFVFMIAELINGSIYWIIVSESFFKYYSETPTIVFDITFYYQLCCVLCM